MIYLLEVEVFQIQHISVELYKYKNISYWRCDDLVQIHLEHQSLDQFSAIMPLKLVF